jgi:hypothetical protein
MWHFKRGKREETFSELDRILYTSTRHTPGFRGYIAMLSHDDANKATILTLWQDEESLRESEKGFLRMPLTKFRIHLRVLHAQSVLSVFDGTFPEIRMKKKLLNLTWRANFSWNKI